MRAGDISVGIKHRGLLCDEEGDGFYAVSLFVVELCYHMLIHAGV